MASVWKRLQRVGKHASKFQFVASYQELMVECTKKWQPDKLVVVWTRRSRRKSSKITGDKEGYPYVSSQTHRTIEVGRHLWRSSGPSRPLKHGHLKLVAQDCVQTAFEFLRDGTLHNFSGQLVPVLSHPHGENVFPDVQKEPSVSLFAH